jgi:hypothetical protein
MCHACFHIGFSGQGGGGHLMYFSDNELKQMEINRLVRSLFVAKKIKAPGYEQVVPRIWKFFENRAKLAKNQWGTSDPSVLANALLTLSDSAYEQAKTALLNTRLLITPKSPMLRAEAIDYWAEAALRADPKFERIQEQIDFVARVERL